MALTVGVDVGGTKVAAAIVDEHGTVLDRWGQATPSMSAEETADAIVAGVSALRMAHDVQAVGIGAAGFVDETRSTVLFAPNLAWREEPLKQIVEGRVNLPVVVENDANSTAWGEARFGAGVGENTLVCITLGTGIGGGIVIDGQLYRGRWGIGAEIGHIRVVPDGRRCGCGNRGCLEQYASGRVLIAEARDLARVSPALAGRMLERSGGSPAAINGPEVTQAARDGDPAALECFRIVGGWLGQGMADIAAVLDPACFIVGGGVAEAGALLLDPARHIFSKALTGRGYRRLASIRLAELGTDAGLVGAADLARQC